MYWQKKRPQNILHRWKKYPKTYYTDGKNTPKHIAQAAKIQIQIFIEGLVHIITNLRLRTYLTKLEENM